MPRKQRPRRRRKKVPAKKRMRNKAARKTRGRYPVSHRLTKSFFPGYPPDRMFVKFKTVFAASLTSTTVTPGFVSFPINDITDPTGALGSFQPYYYDQLEDMYAYYQVFAYKVKYQVMFPQNTSASTPGTAVRISTCASPAGTFASFQEAEQQPFAKNRIYQFQSNPQRKVYSFFVANKVIGLSREQYNTDWRTWGAAINASPSNVVHFNFSHFSLDGSTTTTIIVMFEVEQYTMLHRRKVVPA